MNEPRAMSKDIISITKQKTQSEGNETVKSQIA